MRATPSFKLRNSFILLGLLAAGCERSSFHIGRVPFAPACDVVERTEAYEADIGSGAAVSLVETPDGIMLVAQGWRGVVWYPVQRDGRLGPNAGYIPSERGGGITLFTEATASGFRLWSVGGVVDIDTAAKERRATLYDLSALEPYMHKTVTGFFRASGQSYVQWAATANDGSGPRAVSGLAYVDDNTLQVTPVGAPFYDGPPPPGLYYLGFTGGWDPVEQVYYADLPDRSQVMRVDLNGQVLSMEPIQGTTAYLVTPTRLPSGRWAGGHMWHWITYQPTLRYWTDAPPEFPDTGMNGGSFSDGGATQLLDSQGKLFIAESTQNKIYIHIYDDGASQVSEPALTEMWQIACPKD